MLRRAFCDLAADGRNVSGWQHPARQTALDVADRDMTAGPE
jgi:hypothetical protein